jgi:hypothetical protein
MPQVTFDPVAFANAYPEFATVPQSRTSMMFTIAEQSMLDNTDNSPVMDLNYRTQLFFLLVAHMLLIYGAAVPTGPDNTPPGRISSATQGTVSTAFELKLPEGSSMAAWYNQTKYGATYWMATARFRSAIYIASGVSGIGGAQAYGGSIMNVPGGV